MADPLDVLRSSVTPLDPDPSFAAHLRARIERALTLPKGVTMSDTMLETRSTPRRSGVTLTPYLAVAGADQALRWYGEAFGARVHGDPIVMPDGRIGHAELEIGGGALMLAEEHPEMGVAAPGPGQGAAVTIHLGDVDVDDVISRALAAGAVLERPAADHDYGRNAVLRDPFGHRWMISGPTLNAGVRHGDVGYVSLWVPDVERASAFFSSVLGWRYAPGSAQGRQVEGLSIHHGLWGNVEPTTLFLCFAVADIEAAVERVRAAGGTAGEPHAEPYGMTSECADDQGVRFAMFSPPGGTSDVAGPPTGVRHGDLAYVTMEVVDSTRARRFYGSVLGWRFAPGGVEDGWQVEDIVPMVGVSGGHQRATAVPMYRVDDIERAVEEVRVAGGSATFPEAQPYGITSSCSDDQGTRFYLGQL